MNICVCGDYYTEEFYSKLLAVKESVYIVSHRKAPFNIEMFARCDLVDNVGLEWGAYDYFLKTMWDKKSDVLFCHDDTQVDSSEVFTQIAELSDGKAAWMSGFPCECVFIFRDKEDAIQATGNKEYPSHGRGIFIKASFLHKLLDAGGFKYDENNTVYTKDPTPEGVKDCNWGIREFDKTLKELEANICVAHYPGWYNGWRGQLKKEVA